MSTPDDVAPPVPVEGKVAANPASTNDGSVSEPINPQVEALFNNPMVQRAAESAKWAGFGGVVGYCTGVAAKKVGKQVAMYVGAAFVGLQVLSHYGYIDGIRFDRMNEDAQRALDVNNDGKLDMEDAKIITSRALNMLTKEVPQSAGFGIGLYFGLRS